MDHKHIEELDLVDRYLMGRLTADESEQFEEHFVDCAQCVDQLRTTQDFVRGLRLVASHQPAEQPNNGSRELHLYSPRGRSSKVFGWASVLVLLVAIVGSVIMFKRTLTSQIAADQAKSNLAQSERRFEEERESASSAERKHQETERELAERLTHLQTEIGNKREPKVASAQPQINIPILVLKSTRGSEPQSESVNKLALPDSPNSFVISLPLEGELDYKSYRMTIRDDRGQLIWTSDGLKPDAFNSLSVGFNSSFFRRGDYLLVVDGVSEAGATSVVGKYRFRL
jgi:hypothetical protein